MLDALVIGKGPAGLAAAAELAERGLSVGVLGPPGLAWPARYGAWMDELEEAGCPAVVQNRWTRVTVDTGSRRLDVGRAYGRIDNARLAGLLAGRVERHGGRWIDGEAVSAEHGPASSAVALADGARVEARVVVDASGHRPRLVRKDASPEPAYQTALGWTLETDAHPFGADEAVLMDWSDTHLPRAERRGNPTFLYAFGLGGRRVFVEETALAARPAAPYDFLRGRLKLRLAALGIDASAVAAEEKVWIPMGGAVPKPQRVVGFGAAAAMVHPATGYSVARSLLAAPALARALADELGRGAAPDAAARAAWEAVWPQDRRRRHALFRFGMEMLVRFDAEETRAFFDAFFALPPDDWRAFMSDRASAPGLGRVMARFFAAVPGRVRRALAVGTLSPAGRELAAAMLARA
jgi:lycopene cyclase-like protein